MNPIGLHAMTLVVGGDADAVTRAASIAGRLGYDLLELPILDPSSLDVEAVRAAAAEHGLALATSLGLSPDTDVSSESADAVAAGTALLHDAVDVTHAIGAGWLCGVLASSLGKYDGPPTTAGRANAVAALRDVAAHAGELGLRLGLEIVNRYESNLVTNVGEALDFLDAVGDDTLHIHLDTYHALIEEDSLPGAVELAGDRLGYVHVGQNDRGSITSGTVDLDGFLAALAASGFTGPITFEAFSRATADPSLADRLAIWHSPFTDGEPVAEEALAYLRARTGSDAAA